MFVFPAVKAGIKTGCHRQPLTLTKQNKMKKLPTRRVTITAQSVITACRHADIEIPDLDTLEYMMYLASWAGIPRLQLAQALDRADWPTGTGDEARELLSRIWDRWTVKRCRRCNCELHDGFRLCDRCAEAEDDACERAQQRQIDKFEDY
jgi:hypothetical protein